MLGPYHGDSHTQRSWYSAWSLMEGKVSRGRLGDTMSVLGELIRVLRGII